MSKKLLLVVAALLTSVASFAQWDAPQAPTEGSEVVSGGKYRVKNVAAGNVEGVGAFLAGGSSWYSWATSTVLVGEEDALTFTLTETEKGWTLARPGDGKFTFISGASPQGIENSGEMHVDQGSQDENLRYFSLIKTTGNVYRICAAKANPAFDVAVYADDQPQLFWGWMPVDNMDMPEILQNYPTAVYGTVNPEEGWACDWLFLDYEAYDIRVKMYNLYQDKVADTGLSVDLSAVLSVYNNSAATAEELSAAYDEMYKAINEAISQDVSFENPLDMSDIFNGGSDVNVWTREFTGSGTVGTWHTNTWSVEANDGADGTDMVVPFCEDWVGSGSILSDQKIYMVVKNAAPGLYVFNANVRLYNEAGNVNDLTGCTMYFGDDKVDLSAQVDMYKSGNKCVLWKDGGFRLITVLEETGDIEIGFDIKDATFNWLAFKETSLMYYGKKDAELHAVEFYKEGYSFEKNEEEGYAQTSLVEAYNAAVEAYDNAQTLADVREAIESASTARLAMEASHKAYVELLSKIEEWQLAADQDLNGSDWDDFCAYVLDGAAVEGYPQPTPQDIQDGDRSLSVEEIAAYIEAVEAKYSTAVAHSLTEGSDCTAMLINPKFEDPSGKGWTWVKNDNITALANTGGLGAFPCAEAYGGWASNAGFLFDVYQNVADVPDGIYRISANCFYRWADNGQFNGQEAVPAVIYMNDFESPVQHIGGEGQGLSPEMHADETLMPCGQAFTGDWIECEANGNWIPNGMNSASQAFALDLYKQTVYGIVEGGKMRIGIKKETVTTENRHWCLWTNFKLTFMGQNETAVKEVIASLKKIAQDLLNSEDASKIDEKSISDLEDAMDAATYDELMALNNALKQARASIAMYHQVEEALQAVYDAAGNSMDLGQDESVYEAMMDWSTETLEKLYAQELTFDEMQEILDTYKEKIARVQIVGDWNTATEEEPCDLSSLIVNNNFNQGNINGWTDEFKEGNHGFQNNNVYGDNNTDGEAFCDQFVEAWRSGNVALEDGKIYQTIDTLGYSFMNVLPAGNYILQADINCQNQGDATLTGGLFFYVENGANKYEMELASTNIPEVGTTVVTNKLYFTISEETPAIEFGIKTVNTPYNWFTADNFKLFYIGKGEPIDPNAIEDVIVTPATMAIYDIAGRRVSKAQKGVYVINGKKVIR